MKYIGVKIVDAVEMDAADAHEIGYKTGSAPVHGKTASPGYEVTYPDGYKSWSPKMAFDVANRPVDGLCFGHAIEAIKAGIVKKIARAGWNGKNMFVFLRKGREIKGVDPSSEMGGDFVSLSHLCMRTADGKCCVGWLASQTDILADDWTIVE